MEMTFDGGISEERLDEDEHGNNENEIDGIFDKLIFYKTLIGLPNLIE